jgi:tyrosine-protein phosphatase YwqE
MKLYLNNIQEFIKYGHPYKKGVYFAIFILVIIAAVGIFSSLRHADATSIQAGLTIVAEILGVLLGAVLIIVVLLTEQGQRAEEQLRGTYSKYRRKIETNTATIEKARKQLMKLVKEQKIQLDEHITAPGDIRLDTKFRDVIGNLIGLSIVINTRRFDYYEKMLVDLGFKEAERSEILFGKATLANYDPAHFLKLVEDALDVPCLAQWCSDDVSDFASDIFQEFSQEGISSAISHFERSRKVLRSKSLAASMAFIVASTALAVVTLFGITEQALTQSSIIIVAIVMVGFFMVV